MTGGDSDSELPWELRLGARFGGLDGPPSEPTSLPERFSELGRLGAGGMGEVLRAHDRVLGREVAIKLLPGGGGAKQRERLIREAQALARVQHPNVVRVHDLVYHAGAWLLVLDLAAGVNLEQRLEGGPLAVEEAVRITQGLASGLGALHEQGIVHRDVKPANVMLTPGGEPLLLDLGVSKLLDEARQLTGTGHTIGTPGYMAPEQIADAKRVDARADLYGLGATLYRMLTGEPPLKGESLEQILFRAISEPPTPPHELAPEVDRFLSEICMRCLAKAPEDRYPTASALLVELERHASGERPARPQRTPRGVGWVLVTLGVLGGVGGVGAGLGSRTEPAPEVNVGAIGKKARALLGQPRELLDDAEAIAALAESLPSDAPKSTTSRAGALAGMLALARGQRLEAQAALERIDPQATAAGRALSAALAGDPEGLSRAIGAGIKRLDLRAWRVEARAAQGLTKQTAREVLGDLEALEAQRPLRAAERRHRVTALLTQGKVAAAEAALGEVLAAPVELRWEVALARAAADVADDPAGVFERLQDLPGEGGAPSAREALARRCVELCQEVRQEEAGSGLSEAQIERERLYLRLRGLLAPAVELPDALLRELRSQLAPFSFTKDRLGLALAVADAVPDDAEVLYEIADLASSVRPREREALFPVLRRAARLQSEASRRDRLELVLCVSLVEGSAPEHASELLDLAARLLSRLEAPASRRMVLGAKGKTLVRLDRFPQALQCYDEAIAERAAAPSVFADRGLLLRRMGQPERAFDDLVHYLESEHSSSSRRRKAQTVIWELAREHGWEARALPALEQETERSPDRAGWWIRLAWIQLHLGDQDAARESLRRAPSLADDRETESLAGQQARLLEAFSEDRLRALLNALEQLRGVSSDP